MKLVINGSTINAERADDHASRQLGLMYRNFLPQDSGMLFAFPNSEERSFWMKNTYIPLSIAYLDGNGRILNIEEMEPLNVAGVKSSGPAKFALEMNKGWFKDRGISAGEIVQGLLGNAPTSIFESGGFNLSNPGFHYSDIAQPVIDQMMLDLGDEVVQAKHTMEYVWNYPIAPSVWAEYWEDYGAAFFDVNFEIAITDFPADHPGWNIDATAGWGESSEALIVVIAEFSPDFILSPENLIKIKNELSNVIPHEIHHLTQSGNPFERPNCPATPPSPGDSYYDYFTSACEVPAFLIGFRGESSSSGLAIEKLIDRYLNNYVDVGRITPEEHGDVKDKWMAHDAWEEIVEESKLRSYIQGVLLEVTSLPKEYFDTIDNAISSSKFWEQPNTQDDIDIIQNAAGNSLGTPAAQALAQAIQEAFADLELDIDVAISSHETDDIESYTLHPAHPAYPDRWLIDAKWYVSKQRPGRNTVDMEIMTAEEELVDLDPAALVRHIAQTVRHELVHREQMKKQAKNKGLDEPAAFEEMLQDPSQIPTSGKIEDYLRSHIEIDAHAHDGAEELLAVYGKEKSLDMLRTGFDLSDPKMPNAILHYFEQLPENDPTLDKLRSKLFSQIQGMSKTS